MENREADHISAGVGAAPIVEASVMPASNTTSVFEAIAATGPSRANTLARLDALSRLLDTAFAIPGTNIRFGIDGIVGLIPGIGDVAGAVLSSYLVFEARRLGLPKWKLARMVGNVGIEAAVGAVPLLGDAFDVMFRANRRNMKIIREHFAEDWRQVEADRLAEAKAGGKPVIDGDYRVVERGR